MLLLAPYTLLLKTLCETTLSTGDMIEALWKEYVFTELDTRILTIPELIQCTAVMVVVQMRHHNAELD